MKIYDPSISLVTPLIFKNNLRIIKGQKLKKFKNSEAERNIRYSYFKSVHNSVLLLVCLYDAVISEVA